MRIAHAPRTTAMATLPLLFSLSAMAWAADTRTNTQPSESIDAANCAAAAPERTLLRGAYASQRFRLKRDNSAKESATLPSGLRLIIEYAGCADTVARTFKLQHSTKSKLPSGSDAVAAYARDVLLSLKTEADHRWFDPGLIDFLETVARRPRFDGPYDICMDASPPGLDGCAFETGGGYFFETQTQGGTPTIVVGQYVLL